METGDDVRIFSGVEIHDMNILSVHRWNWITATSYDRTVVLTFDGTWTCPNISPCRRVDFVAPHYATWRPQYAPGTILIISSCYTNHVVRSSIYRIQGQLNGGDLLLAEELSGGSGSIRVLRSGVHLIWNKRYRSYFTTHNPELSELKNKVYDPRDISQYLNV